MAASLASDTATTLEAETMRRVTRRLVPLLMISYFAAYLDRVNVGFAGLTMNKSLDSRRRSSASAAASSSSAISCSRFPAT